MYHGGTLSSGSHYIGTLAILVVGYQGQGIRGMDFSDVHSSWKRQPRLLSGNKYGYGIGLTRRVSGGADTA